MARNNNKATNKRSGNHSSKRNAGRGKSNVANTSIPNGACDKKDRLSSLNDMSWYSHYPELLESTARVPFPNRPGMEMQMGELGLTIGNLSHPSVTYQVPGVASMFWIPAFAKSEKATDPMSIAAREIYSKVRSKFSSSLDADAPDFIMYLGALDSIFAYIGALKRIYRVLDVYTPNNYILPDGLLQGMNISPETVNELRIHKANFNFAINQLVRMSHKFHLPATMDLFNRHYWMNDNVYTDAPDINSQFYVFVQAGFYKFAELNTPDSVLAGGLTLVEAPWGSLVEWTSQTPVADLYKFGTDLIDTLSAWDESYTISGYLLRAYEDAPQFIVDELDIHPEFNPVYVPEVLAQIQNSKGVMKTNAVSINNFGTMDVTQDPKTNAVLYNPSVKTQYVYSPEAINLENIINLQSMNPTTEQVVIATRLHPVIDGTIDETEGAYHILCGTEIPMAWQVRIYSMNTSGYGWAMYGVEQDKVFSVTPGATRPGWTGNEVNALMALDAFEAFDWHPLVRAIYATSLAGSDQVATACYIRGDVMNITSIDDEAMFNIHKVCTYSEFNAFA